MKYILNILPLAAWMVVAASCISSDNGRSESELQNGFYLILNQYTSPVTKAEEGLLIPFSHDFLDENEEGQPVMLEVGTSEFVALELAEEPEGIEQPDKRINLMLTLSDNATEQLANFTEKNLDRHVAIVIGGKAVTIHKIRTRIEGGKMQITRCTDNACKYLLLDLQKNIQ